MGIKQVGLLGIMLILVASVAPAYAAVGDVVATVDLGPALGDPTGYFCSVGLAFDGTNLFVDICGSDVITEVTTAGVFVDSFASGIPENPNAMAYDAKRNGLWIGTQNGLGASSFGCGSVGMPVYFYDFDTGLTTLEFTIPFGLLNPATGESFAFFCFVDGLAYNENDDSTAADDEIWFSDDINNDIGVFRPDGTFVTGYDASTVDPSLADDSGALGPPEGNSGLAIGGPNLYLGNDGGGDVFRASIAAVLGLIDTFVSADDRQEDMECDPVTFAPTEVMWVRTTPQGGLFPNVVTAYEIEPDTCGFGGIPPIIPPPVVGGLMDPIDATAVLAAGVYSSTYWLIPVVLSAVGIGIILIRKRN